MIADAEVQITGSGSVKASEVAIALTGDVPHRAVRLALLADVEGEPRSLLELPRLRKPAKVPARVVTEGDDSSDEVTFTIEDAPVMDLEEARAAGMTATASVTTTDLGDHDVQPSSAEAARAMHDGALAMDAAFSASSAE